MLSAEAPFCSKYSTMSLRTSDHGETKRQCRKRKHASPLPLCACLSLSDGFLFAPFCGAARSELQRGRRTIQGATGMTVMSVAGAQQETGLGTKEATS